MNISVDFMSTSNREVGQFYKNVEGTMKEEIEFRNMAEDKLHEPINSWLAGTDRK